MSLVEGFCCCFHLRTGAIFSGLYVLVLSSLFLTKHALWLRLLSAGSVPDVFEPFLEPMIRPGNETWNPTAMNLTDALKLRNVASHTLHLLWACGGILTSCILLVAIFKKLPLLFLPWLSWASVNGVILLVNSAVDVLIWAIFHLYSSMNAFTIYGYANLPFLIYLLFVTAAYYQCLEALYPNNQSRCCFRLPCKRLWQKVPSTSDGCPPSPNLTSAAGSSRIAADSENQRLMNNESENQAVRGGEILEIKMESTSECKSPTSSTVSTPKPKRSKRNKSKNIDGTVVKKKLKPPKIKISQPSVTDDDW